MSTIPKSETSLRTENDTLGKVEVPGNVYFGAETGRCLINFPVGDVDERMPVSTTLLSTLFE